MILPQTKGSRGLAACRVWRCKTGHILGRGRKECYSKPLVSNLGMHQNHREGLLKNRCSPEVLIQKLGLGLWIYISNKFPDVMDNDDACLGTRPWELLVYAKPSHQILVPLIVGIWRHLAGITPMLLSSRSQTTQWSQPASLGEAGVTCQSRQINKKSSRG